MLPSRLTAGRAEREEVVPVGFDVLVEQDLLTGDLGVLVELRRVPVARDRRPGNGIARRTACPRSCVP